MKDLESLVNQFRTPAFPGSFFFSFEGIEGSGKSTQIKLIKEHLENEGFNVIVLREPGGTPFGEKLRKAILESESDLHPLAETHLFCAARAQLLQEVILKELSEPNTIVICDRFIDSTIAYQGHARGLGIENILIQHATFPLNLVPHRTFYLRIDLETSLERQRKRNMPKDYFESRDDEFHQKLISGYDQSAELFKERVELINGSANEETVFNELKTKIDSIVRGNQEYAS